MITPLDFGRSPVPPGWNAFRLKDVATYVNRGVAPQYAEGDTGVVAFNQKCVRPDLTVAPELGRPIVENSVEPDHPAWLRADDIVINSTGRGTLGRAAIVRSEPEYPVMADGHVTVVRVQRSLADPRFLAYLLGTAAFYQQANTCLAVGATNQTELNREALRRMMVVLPPVDQQRRLANRLDHEVQKIDALVAEHVSQVRLLQDRSAVSMKRRVTGAHGYAGPTHEVGPYWLGPVPMHWRPEKIAWRFATGSGTTPPTGDPEFYDGDVPWVNTSELRENTVLDTSRHVSARALRELSALRAYPAGSVVIALYGATIGRVGVLGADMTVNQACCVLHHPTTVLPEFAFYWLWAHRVEIASLGAGGGQPNISQETVRSLRIPAPERPAQAAIIASLREERARAGELMAELSQDVALLNEHREAVITSVVAGASAVAPEVA